MALVRNTIKFSSGGGSDIIVVANYSALPDPTTVSGQFYWCSASQGTSWLPGSLGGTYYNSGMYYSNGTTWEFINVPFQATQAEVNTGTNTDKFVTPETLKNQNYLATIAYADAKVVAELASFKTANFLDFTSSGQTQLDGKVNKTTWTDYSALSTIVGIGTFSENQIWYKIIDGYMIVDFSIFGTSNSTELTFTVPFASAEGFAIYRTTGYLINQGGVVNNGGRSSIANGSNVVILRRDIAGVNGWAATSSKGTNGQITFKI